MKVRCIFAQSKVVRGGKVCTNSNQNPSNTCLEQIGRVFPSKFRQSATFFALGAQVGARRSPLAMKNNLGVSSKSNDGFPASVQSCCLQGGNAMETKNHLQSKGASVSPHAPRSWGKTWVLLCLTRMKLEKVNLQHMYMYFLPEML